MLTTPDDPGQHNGHSLVALFHRVNSLLPDEQDVVYIEGGASVAEALEIMAQHNFSQLPVKAGNVTVGMFSYRSLARRVAALGRVDVARIEVDDCVEDATFMRVSDDIEKLIESLDLQDVVLVGDPENLIAVATPIDVVQYLYGVTHPFLLIQEIELCLRALVRLSTSTQSLEICLDRALQSKYRDRPGGVPRDLDRLDLQDLVSVVINGDNYGERFTSVLGRNRDSCRSYLQPIPDLRNAVFHFRRTLTTAEFQVLVGTRGWLLRKTHAAEARETDGDD